MCNAARVGARTIALFFGKIACFKSDKRVIEEKKKESKGG